MSKHDAMPSPSRTRMQAVAGLALLLIVAWAVILGAGAIISSNVRDVAKSNNERIVDLAQQDTIRLAINSVDDANKQLAQALEREQAAAHGGPAYLFPQWVWLFPLGLLAWGIVRVVRRLLYGE